MAAVQMVSARIGRTTGHGIAGVLRELQRCRYADRFTGWTTAPSPDGIGEVLVEPT